MHFSLRAILAAFVVLCSEGIASAQVTAAFSASPTSGCAPLIVNFTDASTGIGTGATYSWDFGNFTYSSLQNPAATYLTPGTYTVKLTVSGSNGTDVETKTSYITVYAGPTVSFSGAPLAGCPPLSVSFSSSVTANAPGSLTYTWSYGNGNTGLNVGSSPTHTYTGSGVFPVTLSVKNGAGCITTVLQNNYVTVYPKPSAVFSISNALCKVPVTAYFLNSGGASFTWDFGDNTTGSGNNPSHTYSTAGTYTVKASATNSNGCQDSFSKSITIQANNSSFSGPQSACDSTVSSFTNTSTGVTGYTRWGFGDGTNDTGVSVLHMYTAPGTYIVTMATQVGPCIDTVLDTIVIHPKPVVSISHDVPCLPGNMTFTAHTNVPVATYNWAWGSGGTATGNPVTHYYANCTVDTTYLVVTTAAGCKDTIRVDTTFVPNYIPQVSYNEKGCAPRMVTFNCAPTPNTCISCNPPFPKKYTPSTPCIYPYQINSYTWWVDGVLQTSTTGTMSFNIPNPGSHAVVLKTTTTNGCSRYDTFMVCAGMKVKPSFYAYPDTVVCVGTPVYFKNTTGDSSISYFWYYGFNEADSNNSDYNGYHEYDYPATDTVMLISEVCGCFDTAIKYDYITVRPADAHFTAVPGCPPSKTVTYTNTSIGATTNYWDLGDGTTTTAITPPPHTYPSFGSYAVTHITWNSTYGCRDTIIDTVKVIPLIMDFTGDTTLCLGEPMKLYGTFSGLPMYRKYGSPVGNPANRGINWTINGKIKLHDTPTVVVDTLLMNRGFYSIGWYVQSGDRGQCLDSVIKKNYVLVSHPIAAFGASPTLGCTPMTVVFTDSTSYTPGTQPAMRQWVFGGGGTATNNNPTSTYTYYNPNKYTVKLKVVDWIGCADSITKIQYIEARHPHVNFFPDRYGACVGENVNFTNLSYGATGLIIRWSFGDGDTAMSFSPYHAYKTPGSYTVRLIVSDSTGCTDTMTLARPIQISKPQASFNVSDTLSVCPPLIVNFTSTALGGAIYDWDFGNGSSANIAMPSTTYTAAGVYNVRLIVVDTNLCADTADAVVRILGYSGGLNYSPLSGCAPLTVNLSATLFNVPVIVWDFADGDTALATTGNMSHTYTRPGLYVPKLIYYDSKGCSASSLGKDTIRVDDVLAGFKIIPPCEKTPLTLVDTSHSLFSAITSWRWEFGPGQIATGPNVQRVYPSAGQYPVRLIVTNSRGCIDTLVKNITINPLPLIKASPDTVVCIPDAIKLAASGGVSYAWSPGATLSCTNCDQPMASPTAATSYIVTGTDTNGCANKDTVRIGMQTITSFKVSGGGEICLGEKYQLWASGATTYTWTPASSLNYADSSGPIATPTTTTTYVATGKEGSCLEDTQWVKVVVNPLPTIDAGKDERVVAGNNVQLQVSGSAIERVEWIADPTLSCTNCRAPFAAPKTTTTYYVTAYTNKGCTATDSVKVVVLCNNSQLYIPNTFTPNGDGVNDFFFPQGKGVDIVKSFRIYSRWGELLFERNGMKVNDQFAGWSGTHKGQKLAPDVYVYVIEAECDNGDPIMWKGDVTLVR